MVRISARGTYLPRAGAVSGNVSNDKKVCRAKL